jgi:hypothetical protein
MLELSSNTIKVLGIFGRLSKETESYLDKIEEKYSQKPSGSQYQIFRHLTLTFQADATPADVRTQLELLRDLKKFLPLKIKPLKVFVKDEESMPGAEHIALEFDLSQTKEVIDFVRTRCGDATVATWYIKLLWFVPKQNQVAALDKLDELEELEFSDFYLCANKQDEANTLFTSLGFDVATEN